MEKRHAILNEIMNEHIALPGAPQLIVTRAWAYAWLLKLGYPRVGGFGSADYMAFGRKSVDAPLSDLDVYAGFIAHMEAELA